MLRTISLISVFGILVIGCAAIEPTPPSEPQEVIVKVQTVGSEKPGVAEVSEGESVARSMKVSNPEGSLSELSFVSKDKAFVKIFAELSVADVTRFWNDMVVLKVDYNIRDVDLFISSPGGDAFSGLALADEIERAERNGFRVTAHASGVIASAAVPVFAVCNLRLAAPGTIFMVHEAEIWKWPGQESASDISAQNELMQLLRDRYNVKLAAKTRLDKSKWEELQSKTTWFNAEKAREWGLVDRIE
jgi:ATP-dependent protease ClpP protease subunit